MVTTVALLKSAVNRSPTMNVHAMGDFGFVGNPPRQLDQVRVELDADTAGAVFLRGDDRDAPVAGPEIVDHIIGTDLGQLQHGVGDVVRVSA